MKATIFSSVKFQLDHHTNTRWVSCVNGTSLSLRKCSSKRIKIGWKILESFFHKAAQTRLLHLLFASMALPLRRRSIFRKVFGLNTVVFRDNAHVTSTGQSPSTSERGHRSMLTGCSIKHHVHGKEGWIVVTRWCRRRCLPERKWKFACSRFT